MSTFDARVAALGAESVDVTGLLASRLLAAGKGGASEMGKTLTEERSIPKVTSS